MKIILAKTAGFCFGVRRAVNICEDAAKNHASCATLGPIIHNRSVTAALAEKGVREIADVVALSPGETVIIRSHGAQKGEIEALQKLGAEIIDATCPDVAKIHDIVRRESDEGRTIVIIGQKNHPEIEAISSWCGRCEIFETPSAIREISLASSWRLHVALHIVSNILRFVHSFFTSKSHCSNMSRVLVV